MNEVNFLVSIIVPIYKVESYLEKCIESLINQTYRKIEIVLVDDGSPDRCPQICDVYAQKYEQIRVIHKKNGGLSSARKAGFKIATGEYILFVDSDDYIEKDMVENLINTIKMNNADIAMCGYYTKYKNNTIEHLLPYERNQICGREAVINEYILPLIGHQKQSINIPGFLWIRMLKRKLIEEKYFVPENQYFMEDHVFDLLYADNIEKIAIVDKPLYYYCVNEESLSNCYRKNKWNMYMNLYEFYLTYLEERNIKNPYKRIEGFIATMIFSCIDNAVLTENYDKFKREVQNIKKEKDICNVFFKINKDGMSMMQKLERLLLKYNQYRVLYELRKRRIQLK